MIKMAVAHEAIVFLMQLVYMYEDINVFWFFYNQVRLRLIVGGDFDIMSGLGNIWNMLKTW